MILKTVETEKITPISVKITYFNGVWDFASIHLSLSLRALNGFGNLPITLIK